LQRQALNCINEEKEERLSASPGDEDPQHLYDLHAIERRLQTFQRLPASRAGRAAAVAIALCRDSDGAWCFPLTVRASGLRAHPGQYALPGGHIASGESAWETASRETEEEVGLAAGQWRRHHLLDDYITRSGSLITPVVLVSDTPLAGLQPNPTEVASAFYVRMDALGAVEPLAAYDDTNRAFAIHVAGHLVFAPTGAILLQFWDLVREGRTTRVQDVGEPMFAWA
jgi:8-oxo-dGTP pyrophosphatase MutT (NUDIX family)